MHGKEDAQAEDGHNQNEIVHRVVRPAGKGQNKAQTRRNNGGRQQIDLDDLPKPDAKQTQDHFRLLEKGVRQKAYVAVHEQGLGKAGPAVDGIHDKGEIGEVGEREDAHVPSVFLRQEEQEPDQQGKYTGGDNRNPLRGLPQNFLVAPDE